MTPTTTETIERPTPAGGVRMTIQYTDDEGNPADKDSATRAKIVEYDSAGQEIITTYAELG